MTEKESKNIIQRAVDYAILAAIVSVVIAIGVFIFVVWKDRE